MNLLEMMHKEVQEKNITDKKEIKDYLYERMGEIFEYNPTWIFANDKEREQIRNWRVDMENMETEDLYITCFQWAPLFCDLLKSFMIPSYVEENENHACVISYINGKMELSDLMHNYEDLMNIKFGLNTQNNHDVRVEKEQSYSEALNEIRKYLQNLNLKPEEYIYKTFKIVEVILNKPRPDRNIGYISGIRFISKLLKYFVHENYKPVNNHFFNPETGDYVEGYEIKIGNKVFHFVYKQNESKQFTLSEIGELEYNTYKENYNSIESYHTRKTK